MEFITVNFLNGNSLSNKPTPRAILQNEGFRVGLVHKMFPAYNDIGLLFISANIGIPEIMDANFLSKCVSVGRIKNPGREDVFLPAGGWQTTGLYIAVESNDVAEAQQLKQNFDKNKSAHLVADSKSGADICQSDNEVREDLNLDQMAATIDVSVGGKPSCSTGRRYPKP